MERLNLVRNGVIRLPPGFRFLPTDEELVLQYLKRKVFAHPLPASIIPEVDVWKQDPWVLPGDSKRVRYFFSCKSSREEKFNKPNRETRSGFWKPLDTDKEIVDSKSNKVAGMKKTLVFYYGKPTSEIRTEWIMHEYCLFHSESTQNSMVQMGDWVLCRIFLLKRNIKSDGEIVQPSEENGSYNLEVVSPNLLLHDRRASSTSSGISHASFAESNHKERGGCGIISTSSRREP